MRTIWVKIKEFFGKIWRSLTTAGRMVIGLGALIIIVMLAFAFAKDTDEARHDHSPEIAQVLQPSIGEPLEPDIPAQNNGNPTDENSIYNRGVGPSALTFVAPASGINPDEPIRYHSDSLKFKVVLPPHAQVSEQPGGVQFTSQSSKLHYIVSVYNAEGETLPGIEAQLRNSPTAAAKIGRAHV